LKTILLVDDDRSFITLIGLQLMKKNYEVIPALDGAKGLELAKKMKPNLILLDVLLPKISGFDFLKKISEENELKDTPTIVVSSRPDMKNFFSSFNIVSFLSKPVVPQELITLIQNTLEQGPSSAANGSKTTARESQVVPPVVHDKNKGKKILILGIEDNLMEKVKNHLKALGFTVSRGLDEQSTIQEISEFQPDIIMCQFWEDTNKLDPSLVQNALQKSPETKSIPFYVFVQNSISLDALATFKADILLPYKNSDDLLKTLEGVVKPKTASK
jgi:DNA-binding response OmpR family regulator